MTYAAYLRIYELVYTTGMSRARRPIARGLAALCRPAAGCADAGCETLRAKAELSEVGRRPADFHPYSLVELDYGGLYKRAHSRWCAFAEFEVAH